MPTEKIKTRELMEFALYRKQIRTVIRMVEIKYAVTLTKEDAYEIRYAYKQIQNSIRKALANASNFAYNGRFRKKEYLNAERA